MRGEPKPRRSGPGGAGPTARASPSPVSGRWKSQWIWPRRLTNNFRVLTACNSFNKNLIIMGVIKCGEQYLHVEQQLTERK